MRALLLLLALFSITGCLYQPDFQTKHGVTVRHEGDSSPIFDTRNHPYDGLFVTKPVAEEMEDFLIEGMSKLPRYPEKEIRRCLPYVNVYVLDAPVMTCYSGVQCAGEQNGPTLTIARAGRCPWESAYIHEIAHFLQDCVGNVYDPNHSIEPEVWELVASAPDKCS